MALEQTYERKHDGYHRWRRNCLPTRSTWLHPRFL